MEMAQHMKRVCEEIESLCRENMGEYEMHRMQELAGVTEEAKPSAGLSQAKKSATVKKAKAGSDIGKHGKSFKDVAAKAAKKYGSEEKGKKVAAAAMWKNVPR